MDEIKNEQNNQYILPAAIVLAGVLVAVAVIYTSGYAPKGNNNDVVAGEDQKAGLTGNVEEVLAVGAGDMILGSPAAKVTIIEYADFQCPFCGRFFSTTLKQLKDKYVKSGQARIVFRDFAFLGEESVTAGEAARCAGDQNKFWEFHDYLFTHQAGENQGVFSIANLKKFAGLLKIDQGVFDSCLDSHKYKSLVEESTAKAQSIGVTGTPTTFVNGQEVVGAQPIGQFDAVIQAMLK
jgi:protein-disulfide isomerase